MNTSGRSVCRHWGKALLGAAASARFTSPLLPDDLPIMTRPVSYLEIAVASADGAPHAVAVSVSASEELCLDCRGQDALRVEMLQESGIALGKIGSGSRISAKLRGWFGYKDGDKVPVHLTKMHFFDPETTNAIRKEGN